MTEDASESTLQGPAVQVVAALGQMVEADGYRIEASEVRPGLIDVAIIAADGACSDCLVPKSVMRGIVAGRFSDVGVELGVLRYPDEGT